MTDISQNDPSAINLDDATLDTGGFDWLLPERKKRKTDSTKPHKKKFSLNMEQIKARIGEKPYKVVEISDEQKQNAFDMARINKERAANRIQHPNTVTYAAVTRQPK